MDGVVVHIEYEYGYRYAIWYTGLTEEELVAFWRSQLDFREVGQAHLEGVGLVIPAWYGDEPAEESDGMWSYHPDTFDPNDPHGKKRKSVAEVWVPSTGWIAHIHMDDDSFLRGPDDRAFVHFNHPETRNEGRDMTFEQRVAFFLEHAAWSYDPKTETPERGQLQCARRLARAEKAVQQDPQLSFRWSEEDSDPELTYDSDVHGETIESIRQGDLLWLCAELCSDEEGILDSLGGVCVASLSDPYIRVVEAELAANAGYGELSDLEKLAELKEELG